MRSQVRLSAVFWLFLVSILLFSSSSIKAGEVSGGSFNISERTEYGISENVVFLTVCDNVGKAQYVNVSSVFKDDFLTNAIVFSPILFMKSPFNNVIQWVISL